jgi:hypothetical protein
MPSRQEIVEKTAKETGLFLGRRLRKLRTRIGGVLNINPFLMRALKDFHQIKDQQSLAEFMLAGHLAGGHATAFGNMIDEKILPQVFATKRLDSTCRHEVPYSREIFDDIDHLVDRKDGQYMLSLKAGAWTIQLGQAMGLYRHFLALGEEGLQGKGIVVGVFYGHSGLLTDKYRIVRGENVRHQTEMQQLDYVSVKAGQQFWSWLNDEEAATQDWLREGIAKGADDFLAGAGDMLDVVGGAAHRLMRELRTKYGFPEDGSLDWSFLLHAINDDKGSEVGSEAIEDFPPSEDG